MIYIQSHFLGRRRTSRVVVGNSFIFVIDRLLHVASDSLVHDALGNLGESSRLGRFCHDSLGFVLVVRGGLHVLGFVDGHLGLHDLFGSLL